ncbi:hypothetical protein Sya03_00490 [Spirilliplanes yamanashiensis]|uniref:DUF5667 domain-containing protein n=1 Tax=Spirilliplanes yamanashiensis TaxID=42233 RepID=A0A8J3Y374_9ACTN|nr:hypothetical protein [Spirilliplanes yamanashiensis]GIJ00697.1 hypothetical protein Sya03_00490 [Spirilliplanes yamanashiensis]
MSLDFLDRRRAERFAQLLDETNGGPRHHSHGRGDDDLAELAAVGNTLTAMRPAVRTEVDREFRQDLRAMLIATAEREGIGVTAAPGTAEIDEPRRRFSLGAGSGRRLRARGAIVAGVAVGAVAVSGMSFASEDAVPGDALYGVKRSAEKAQLALAGSDVTRGQLFLGFARNRLAEAAAVQAGGTPLTTVLGDMDRDTREGVRLLTTSAVQRKDPAPFAVVDTFVLGQRRQLQPLLARVGPADQEAAVTSITLLDAIERRVAGLRKGLDCGTTGADGLGPLPRTCSAAPQGIEKGSGTGKSTTGKQGQQREQDAERGTGSDQQGTGPATGTGTGTGSTGAGTGTGATADEVPGGGQTGAAVPDGEPSDGAEAPAPQPGAEDEGLIGRIFGGILG